MKRKVLRVQYVGGQWRIAGPGVPDAWRKHDLKTMAVGIAAAMCRDEWRWFGTLWQLVIHCKDGVFQSERTYGRDPVRHKG